MKKTSLWILLGFVLLTFLYFPSYSKYLKLKRQEERLSQDIIDLKTKIEGLKKEEALIQHDPAYLEHVMRKELGLVKPGEVVYKLVPEKTESQKSAEKQKSVSIPAAKPASA